MPNNTDSTAGSDCPSTPCSPPPFDPPKGSFQKELEHLINCKSLEGGSDTPDFILAEYLRQCLDAFDMATRRREEWYGRVTAPCDPPSEENDQIHPMTARHDAPNPPQTAAGQSLGAMPCCASSAAEWKPDYSVTPRRVVCAANRRRDDGRIICGARHWDKVMRDQITDADRGAHWDQGFIDQFGDWMTREEAWIVAADQNQIRRRCGGDGERLFSENLY